MPTARTSGWILMNSSTALVPPFFTPTMIAFGNFLFPNFTLLPRWRREEGGLMIAESFGRGGL